MTRRQKRLVILVVVLLAILLALGAYFWYYSRTKQLSFDLTGATANTVIPPEFLFAFSGTGGERLQRPIGVLVDGEKVYVTDSVRSKIFTYDLGGNQTGSFGASETLNPLYLAKSPKDGNLYVTDRRRYAVLKFTPQGKFLGEFDPKLPKSELAKFETRGVQWQPIAIAFAPNGTMYVTEILNGHRLLIFGPDGKFKKSIGTVGIVNDPTQAPQFFQFPNGLMVLGKELYVSDSNNQRVKVYSLDGDFKRTIVTRGLPRGIVALQPFATDDEKAPKRFVEVDTLAHDATIWTVAGEKIVNFGEQGILDGQFSYPGGISRGPANKLYIADTSNGRVQVWGWPAQAAGIPQVEPGTAAWCLLPLAFLPLLLLFRKKTFFATEDFVVAMVEREEAGLMPHRRRRWRTTEAEYEKIRVLRTEMVNFEELFEPVEYSESDARALMDKYELDEEIAITLSVAKRAKVACTETDELRRMAKVLEIDVVNSQEFVERFAKREAAEASDG